MPQRLPLALWRLALGLLCVCGVLASTWAQQTVPALTAHVVDGTGTLSAQQLQALDEKLSTFEASKGTQFVVLLVTSTQPEDIASYANRVANTWKIGRKDVGDGLLLVVARDDRKLRIEVAKTLEGAIPDLLASRVIEQFITPRFKAGDYAGGLDAGLSQLITLVTGEALPQPVHTSQSSSSAGFQWMDMLIFMFFAVPVVGTVLRQILGSKLGALATGAGVGAVTFFITASVVVAGLAGMAALLFSLLVRLPFNSTGGTGRGGSWNTGGFGGGGGRNGGGFSSGGGGDFGGGGASGSW